MNFNTSPLKTIELPNKSILRKIKEGSKINWVFIPGGPGLGEEYLSEALQESTLQGSIYTYSFPRFDSNFSDEDVLRRIESDIKTICGDLKDLILVGHSFGGMLLQTINLDKTNYLQQVLLCSSPNLACFTVASSSYNQFRAEDKILQEQAQSNYESNKNDIGFKELFKSWAPYYVERKDVKKYLTMIENCTVDQAFYEWGNRFFYKLFEKNGKIPSFATIIGSDHDRICPIKLYNSPEVVIPKTTKIVTLQSSSHFPWVENSDLFDNALRELESRIISEK